MSDVMICDNSNCETEDYAMESCELCWRTICDECRNNEGVCKVCIDEGRKIDGLI